MREKKLIRENRAKRKTCEEKKFEEERLSGRIKLSS